MSISSTINLPPWSTQLNNDAAVKPFAEMLAKYAPGLRGFTAYPDSARGGQPITAVEYAEAVKHRGVRFEENEEACRGGICGL